jgi:hypothetical protein
VARLSLQDFGAWLGILSDRSGLSLWLDSELRSRTGARGSSYHVVPSVAIGSLNDGKVQYYSRLVGCGYLQVAGVNHSSDEISAGVISIFSIRFIMSLTCQKSYILSQADITGGYFKSYFRNEMYMEPLPTCEGPMVAHSVTHKVVSSFADSSAVYMARVKRSLYGLKQCGYAWSECLHVFLLMDPKYAMGFIKFTGNPLFFRKVFRAQRQTGGNYTRSLRRRFAHLFLIRRSSALVYEPA